MFKMTPNQICACNDGCSWGRGRVVRPPGATESGSQKSGCQNERSLKWPFSVKGLTKYLSRCKYQIKEQCVVCYVAVVQHLLRNTSTATTNCHITHNTLIFKLIFTSGQVFC